MYHYVTDKEFLGNVRSVCADVVNRTVQKINIIEGYSVRMHLIGSGAKNLITQNEKEPIDLDYNIIVDSAPNINDCRAIKETIRKAFNEVLKEEGWGDCSDSTSALRTERRVFRSGNKTEWSIDVGIVAGEFNDGWYRLIHRKTGVVKTDIWVWEKAQKSEGLEDMAGWLKDNGLWGEVRETYLDKKNLHLKHQEEDVHPSFNSYIEAVHEVYYAHKR